MACCSMHDRLDLKLTTLQYVSAECGSIKSITDPGTQVPEGKPEYCCFDCPTLLEKHSNDPRPQA